ncbi:MAG: hypothetical protein LCH61_01270 [Proteobacteria bacterium]|nr:hypothetical protein [Pseudomonadota bacterium]
MQPNTALPTMLALWSAGCHLTLSKVSPQIMSGACNRRSRLAATVTLALPASLKTPADLAEAQASILTAMGSGDITTDEAADAAKVIEAVGAAMERRELEARIAALETKEAGK